MANTQHIYVCMHGKELSNTEKIDRPSLHVLVVVRRKVQPMQRPDERNEIVGADLTCSQNDVSTHTVCNFSKSLIPQVSTGAACTVSEGIERRVKRAYARLQNSAHEIGIHEKYLQQYVRVDQSATTQASRQA